MAFRTFLCVVLSALVMHAQPVLAAESIEGKANPWQWHFQPAATPVMQQLSGLHNYLEIIAVSVAVFVLCLMVYVCLRFRRSVNPIPSKTTHNTLVEIIWTVLPIAILVSVAIPSLRLHYYMGQVADPEMTLKVTGYQWYWGYEYPDQGVSEFQAYIKEEKDLKPGDTRLLSTDKPVVVPIDTTVRVQMTAADVIHSWAVPAFGVKQDAVPGRLNESWFRVTKPGIYYGQCSELCGVKHGFMPIEIHAVDKPVFAKWVERAKTGNFEVADLVTPAAADTSAVISETKPVASPAIEKQGGTAAAATTEKK
jgi:cytochrome c oxidase subunit II